MHLCGLRFSTDEFTEKSILEYIQFAGIDFAEISIALMSEAVMEAP